MDRVADLRQDYERLGALLFNAGPGEAASLARERRLIGELLEALEKPEEASVVDQLAARRRTSGGDSGPSRGRRKSG